MPILLKNKLMHKEKSFPGHPVGKSQSQGLTPGSQAPASRAWTTILCRLLQPGCQGRAWRQGPSRGTDEALEAQSKRQSHLPNITVSSSNPICLSPEPVASSTSISCLGRVSNHGKSTNYPGNSRCWAGCLPLAPPTHHQLLHPALCPRG